MRILNIFCTLLLLLLPERVFAQDDQVESAEQKGLNLAQEASRRNEGFGDTAVELSMVLLSTDGRQRTRRLTWKILEKIAVDEGDKSLTIFHEPRDIAGTGFLTHTHISQTDDQWLYLPALKRVKRIASANMSSAFVGSEFAYEDLLSDEVEKFNYEWLRDESCAELTCYVVQREPRYANSGYSRQLVWMDQKEFRIIKNEFYDRDGELKKTLRFEDYKLYLDKYWRAHNLRMENHQTGKVTLLQFAEYHFRAGLGAQAFSPDALKRIR
jgi:outer membrane lipoprotein-sorting protein